MNKQTANVSCKKCGEVCRVDIPRVDSYHVETGWKVPVILNQHIEKECDCGRQKYIVRRVITTTVMCLYDEE